MSSEKQNMELVDKGWEQMRSVLDRELPEEDKDILPFWWFVFGVVLLLVSSGLYWVWDQTQSPSKGDKTEVATERLEKGEDELQLYTVVADVDQIKSSLAKQKYVKESQLYRGMGYEAVEGNGAVQERSRADGQRDQTTSFDQPVGHKENALTGLNISNVERLQALPLQFFDQQRTTNFDPIELASIQTPQTSTQSQSFFMRIMGLSNMTNQIALQLDAGLTYSLGGNWSASSSVGYQYNYFGQNSVYNVRFNAEGEVVSAPGPNTQFDYSESNSTQLNYDNLTQHLLLLTQSFDYLLSPKWSLFGEANLGYALKSGSHKQLMAQYPVVYDDNTIELRQNSISSDRVDQYTASWYYGLRLGGKYHFSHNLVLQAGLSTLQSLRVEQDKLNLDGSRKLLFDIGFIWSI